MGGGGQEFGGGAQLGSCGEMRLELEQQRVEATRSWLGTSLSSCDLRVSPHSLVGLPHSMVASELLWQLKASRVSLHGNEAEAKWTFMRSSLKSHITSVTSAILHSLGQS